MGSFTVENAYLTPNPCSADESEDDFEIDSNVSDADLLELKQELKKLGPEKAQRYLADATIAPQEMTWQKWMQYPEFVRKDHLTLLKSCPILVFKGYLIRYHRTHPRALRLNAYESVWKTMDTFGIACCETNVEGGVEIKLIDKTAENDALLRSKSLPLHRSINTLSYCKAIEDEELLRKNESARRAKIHLEGGCDLEPLAESLFNRHF